MVSGVRVAAAEAEEAEPQKKQKKQYKEWQTTGAPLTGSAAIITAAM
jgi:hypothetical protein